MVGTEAAEGGPGSILYAVGATEEAVDEIGICL